MSDKIVLPKLGLTMEHGIIMGWAKEEGDEVRKGDILFQVESDKAVVDVESDYEGVLLKRYFVEGDDVPCGNVVAIIGKAGEAATEIQGSDLEVPDTGLPAPEIMGKETGPRQEKPVRNLASPRARRRALQEGIDLSLIGHGSGDDGRIKEKDVVSFVETQAAGEKRKISPVAKNLLEASGTVGFELLGSGPEGRIMKRDALDYLRNIKRDVDSSDSGQIVKVPVSGMRETIARRLSESKGTIPHYYITIAVDMTNFVDSRKMWNSIHPEKKVSMNAMLLKIVASGLKKNPIVNSSWSKDGILIYPSVDIALAVATERGLVTPVVRHCESKGVLEIESEISDLVGKARAGQLGNKELSSSTCTISNLGMYGVEEFSAIINPPEAAILAIASIVDTPVAMDKAVVVRPIMRITMSADHRVIDGAASASFLGDLRSMLENPFFSIF